MHFTMSDIHWIKQTCLNSLGKMMQNRFFVNVHTACYEGIKEMPLDTIYMHLLSDLPLVFIKNHFTFFQRTTYLEEVIAGPPSLLQLRLHCAYQQNLL